MTIMTEDQFDTLFTVIPADDGDLVRANVPQGHDAHHVFTIVEGDDDHLYAVEGIHYVNRVGYLLTEEAWEQEICALWA